MGVVGAWCEYGATIAVDGASAQLGLVGIDDGREIDVYADVGDEDEVEVDGSKLEEEEEDDDDDVDNDNDEAVSGECSVDDPVVNAS